LSPKFAYYALISEGARQYFEATAKGVGYPAVDDKDFNSFTISLPPLPEQHRIAEYLDASCAAIDAAAVAKRRQLAILDTLRVTVIQESVTKGLDPNVEMRVSDIDWLPEIPKHWNTAKLKRHVQMIRGQFSHRPRNDPVFYDGPYPFIQTGSISATDKFITEFTQTLNEDGLRISKLFPANTVVMTITGAKIAEVAVTTFEACFPDSIVGFVPDHHLNRDYLYYLLVAMKQVLLRAMVVTTQPNINYVQIGGTYIPVPPVRQQESITKHIEQRIQGIREIQKSLNQQLTTLTAYRKSLIHECVTGQRRITNTDVQRAVA
jgi:type I restriction enzyme S subunit